MFATYVVVTVLTAVLNGSAAVANLIGHDYPKSQADKMGIPHSWMPLLGTAMGAGALGLVAGFAVPPLGVIAAVGLVLYFLGALWVHLRVGDHQLGAWVVFFCLPVAALFTNLAYHGTW
ncbi:DoxX family protein [Streptomyces sp. NPDC007818]|uniref:DoxX family protein n=1 Tax=Streptomyces sp. NPDC007818 TaxID=3364780 RepID=UPI003687C6E3